MYFKFIPASHASCVELVIRNEVQRLQGPSVPDWTIDSWKTGEAVVIVAVPNSQESLDEIIHALVAMREEVTA